MESERAATIAYLLKSDHAHTLLMRVLRVNDHDALVNGLSNCPASSLHMFEKAVLQLSLTTRSLPRLSAAQLSAPHEEDNMDRDDFIRFLLESRAVHYPLVQRALEFDYSAPVTFELINRVTPYYALRDLVCIILYLETKVDDNNDEKLASTRALCLEYMKRFDRNDHVMLRQVVAPGSDSNIFSLIGMADLQHVETLLRHCKAISHCRKAGGESE